MTLSFDLFWSFRSSYCYLALDRILDMTATYDLEVNVRPVWPLAIRNPEFFTQVHPNHLRYHLLDSKRIAESLGIPYRRPNPDPIIQDMETGRIAPDQPYIFRLTRLGMAAVLAGRGLPFIDQVSRILWDGSTDGWNEGPHLIAAAARAGLDLGRLEQVIASDPSRFDALIEANQKALEAAGHWGVPTMVFDGEPFFGQDRLNVLTWRMRQNGLRERVLA
ncbi:2-hydroxychromene-2-carboxylate isomerase [Microvirga arabica]|uniref:2-hydroxychromene-2-carboxylate isomerase n=1 Tax=Microvirga arabica TaxID=1128671 RepID=UPI001939D05C|nr:DsbA family protein [Microvirga arabica]MBM1171489.1 DsbA family protein [Microvirga arabica]